MLLRIAFRNVFRNGRRTSITLVVVVFGAVAMILFGGYKTVTFYNLRESTIRNRLGHLQIFARGYLSAKSQKPLQYGLDDVRALRGAVESDPRVKMTAAQISLMGLISNGESSETFLATAVEPEKDRSMSSVRLRAGSWIDERETDGVMLGRGLAEAMNARPNDYLTLMTTTTTGSLNAIDVRVAGIFSTGVKEFDDRAIKMPLGGAQQLLQTARVERLIVMLHDTEDTKAVETALLQTLRARGLDVEMKDWSDLATFYHQVVLLYNGIFGFLGIVVFAIVILSVMNTTMMSIFERTREIGTLMAIGTTRARVWNMFLLEGFFIGAIGAALGIAAGLGTAALINAADLMLPPPPGYTVGYLLRIRPTAPVLTTALLISVITATVSAVTPAFKASRLKIVDALGHI
ncbi:MAG TPA: FtsX-like permease family protein [Thermoanaerobaculia bacterium]|nr:FtsX-like permease family protein [Thermoanaerobaculia bacterium]